MEQPTTGADMIVEYIRYRIAEAVRRPSWPRLTRVSDRHVLPDDLIGPRFAHLDDEHPEHVAM
jgi:hypothetical protein